MLNQLESLYEVYGEIENINIDLLDNFKDHPFNLYEGKRLEDLVENIKKNGVINPIIVRIKGDRFEILSGHNRVNACKLLGVESIPAIIKEDLSEQEAKDIMIDTNLYQRSFHELSLSEQALVVTQMNKKFNNQGKTLTDEEGKKIKYNSRGRIAENYDLSETKVHRLLKINHLIEGFKILLDNKKITMQTALKIASLSSENQYRLLSHCTNYDVKITNKLIDKVIKQIHELELKEIVKSFMNVKDKQEYISLKISKALLENKFGFMDKKLYEERLNMLLKNNGE